MSGIEWPWLRRLQPILQSEGAECGLASLAMVANYPVSYTHLTLPTN